MNNGGFMGGFYVLSEWIMKLYVVNLLWVISNLPILFILLNMFLINQTEIVYLSIIPLVILLPILSFPATSALFSTVRDWIMKNEGHGGIFKSFWYYYKENYKRSLLGGIIFIAIWGIWIVDIYYVMNQKIIIISFFIILGIVLYVWTINFFIFTAHYDMKLFSSLKNALLITVGSPKLFITVVISTFFILYISINTLPFLFVFFTFSLLSFLSFGAFYISYLKIVEKNKIVN